MNFKENTYLLAFISFGLCLLMLTDAHITPTKKNYEVIENLTERLRFSRKSASTYHLKTNKSKCLISYNLFSVLSIGDTICLYRSIITNAKIRIAHKNGNKIYSYNLCSASETDGTILIVLITTGNLMLLFFYRKLKNVSGRTNLVILAFLITALLFYNHVFL